MQRQSTAPTVSDLSHRPAEVLGAVDSTDVLITRRDAEDVLVSTVARVDAERSSIASLLAVVQKTWHRTQNGLIQVLGHTYPWMRSLPKSDQKTFINRYADVLAECAAHRDFQPLVILLNQWEYTASIYRDGKLLEALLAPIVEDDVTGKEALMPSAATKQIPTSRARRIAPAHAAKAASKRR
jgi:hypothetical protein